MSNKTVIDRVLDWWFKPFSVQYIRIYEVLMCLTMVYYFGGYMTQMEWWVGDLGFHASAAATSSHYLPPPPRPTAEWFTLIVTTFYLLVGGLFVGLWTPSSQLGVLCIGSVCTSDGSTFGIYHQSDAHHLFFHARRTAFCTNGS